MSFPIEDPSKMHNGDSSQKQQKCLYNLVNMCIAAYLSQYSVSQNSTDLFNINISQNSTRLTQLIFQVKSPTQEPFSAPCFTTLCKCQVLSVICGAYFPLYSHIYTLNFYFFIADQIFSSVKMYEYFFFWYQGYQKQIGCERPQYSQSLWCNQMRVQFSLV